MNKFLLILTFAAFCSNGYSQELVKTSKEVFYSSYTSIYHPIGNTIETKKDY